MIPLDFNASENHINSDPFNLLTKVEIWDTLRNMLSRRSPQSPQLMWCPGTRVRAAELPDTGPDTIQPDIQNVNDTDQQSKCELSKEEVEKRTRTYRMICSPVEYCLQVTIARYKRGSSGRLQTP